MVDTIHSVAATVGQNPESVAAVQAKRGQGPSKDSGPKRSGSAPAASQSREIPEVVDKLNTLGSQIANTKISFSIDSETGKPIVRVINKETGQIIRQLPPEDLLKLVDNLQNLTGLIFSEEI